MSNRLKYVLGLFFEKKIPNKKNNLFLTLNFVDFIILTVDYYTDIELFSWLFIVVTLGILVLAFSIHIDERKKRQKRL
ncbi:hypothetical protein [Peribacillus sp. R9-11]|uniref:hypothetical protein n=1 Tax=Peribacillus sp. R9-11 TaxID=3073271 RepID=UPI002868FA3D|nr:hypothetical protein [Peribacillus sp. R9-11]WMX58661.1 hypothetical protein RE409_27800 [Peribacillus sp. R9-11]